MTNNSMFKVENLFNVKGWVAVVTGEGTGIGLMCAQAFANNGARVYIVGRRKEALDRAVEVHGRTLANGGKLIAVTGDTSTKETISELVKEISSREKYINVLVNNAGINTSHRHSVEKGDESAKALSEQLWGVEQSEWEDVYRTNVIGYYYTTVAFIPLLAEATKQLHGHSACVINNASMSGKTRTSQHHYQYNVSKGAAIHLNTVLAQELRRPEVKIRVNSFSPGIFPSEMTAKESGPDQKSHISSDGFLENKGIPAGRPGKDDDIAQLVLMLAVNTYINGENVHVDGGYLLEHP
ncbi:NAD(P)-binding protein [Ramaria rubella]|nr:NAD(P)-binding protein [Ramaria rubella]